MGDDYKNPFMVSRTPHHPHIHHDESENMYASEHHMLSLSLLCFVFCFFLHKLHQTSNDEKQMRSCRMHL